MNRNHIMSVDSCLRCVRAETDFREITKDQMKQLDITYGLEVVELYDGKMKAAGMPNSFIIH